MTPFGQPPNTLIDTDADTLRLLSPHELPDLTIGLSTWSDVTQVATGIASTITTYAGAAFSRAAFAAASATAAAETRPLADRPIDFHLEQDIAYTYECTVAPCEEIIAPTSNNIVAEWLTDAFYAISDGIADALESAPAKLRQIKELTLEFKGKYDAWAVEYRKAETARKQAEREEAYRTFYNPDVQRYHDDILRHEVEIWRRHRAAGDRLRAELARRDAEYQRQLRQSQAEVWRAAVQEVVVAGRMKKYGISTPATTELNFPLMLALYRRVFDDPLLDVYLANNNGITFGGKGESAWHEKLRGFGDMKGYRIVIGEDAGNPLLQVILLRQQLEQIFAADNDLLAAALGRSNGTEETEFRQDILKSGRLQHLVRLMQNTELAIEVIASVANDGVDFVLVVRDLSEGQYQQAAIGLIAAAIPIVSSKADDVFEIITKGGAKIPVPASAKKLLAEAMESGKYADVWLDLIARKIIPNPSWVQEAASSRKLREALGLVTGDGYYAHHIVPGALYPASKYPTSIADESRRLLEYYQIGINEAVNGAALKFPEHYLDGLHTIDHCNRVCHRLRRAVDGVEDWATGRAKMLEQLAIIKQLILSGKQHLI